MSPQIYEDYWQITNAFTDYNGKKFLDTLQVCIDFIDKYRNEPYSEIKYNRLQEMILEVNLINKISIRKSINQLVKMWFIEPYLISYHELSKEYLNSKTNKKREILLSKIIYSNSGFNKAVNKNSPTKQINFLIQTLIENGSLSKSEIIALMLVDIDNFHNTFLDKEELKDYVDEARKIWFVDRKYNQISYLINLLSKLDDLVVIWDDLYFKEDAEQNFEEIIKISGRDPYLHRLYKNQLKEESEELFWKVVCVVEKLDYPVIIASHIKPFIDSNKDEAYDPNNWLLLSRTLDSLFDLKYISFSDEWKILFSDKISFEIRDFWWNFKIDSKILNPKRIQYLRYHRDLVKKKYNLIEST